MCVMVLSRPSPIDSSPLRAERVPDPEPGPGEVRRVLRRCAICRTDLHVDRGRPAPAREPPVIPGHQVVGVVDGSAPARPGSARRPARHPVAGGTDGTCRYCRRGQENLCLTPVHRLPRDGGYAEAWCREEFAYACPTLRRRAAAPLLCAGIIGYRALRRADLRPGGPLGSTASARSAHVAIHGRPPRGAGRSTS